MRRMPHTDAPFFPGEQTGGESLKLIKLSGGSFLLAGRTHGVSKGAHAASAGGGVSMVCLLLGRAPAKADGPPGGGLGCRMSLGLHLSCRGTPKVRRVGGLWFPSVPPIIRVTAAGSRKGLGVDQLP